MPPRPEDRLINAKFAMKFEIRRLAKMISKTNQKEADAKKKLLKVMKSGDEEMIDDQALLLASFRAQSKELTKLKTKLEMFDEKADMADVQQSIATGMGKVSQALGSVTSSLKLDKFEQSMSELQKQYDDMDVMTSVMETSTARSTAKSVAQEEVDLIKRQVADEAGIELSQQLNSPEPITSAPSKTNQIDEDELGEKLKNLRVEAAT